LESSASALDESDKEDLRLFCAIFEGLKEIIKISTYIEHVQILTQSPFTTIERTMKESGASNHLVKKS